MAGRAIALVHYTAPPVVGGVETIVGRHARLLAGAGHAVRIVAGRGGPAEPGIGFELIEHADSIAPGVVAVSSELVAGIVSARYAELVDQLEAEVAAALTGIDLAIIHNIASMNRNLALTAALHRIAGRADAPRFVLWYHDLAWRLPRYRSQLHDGQPWDLLRTAWPDALSVTISEARRVQLASLLGLPAEEIAVVPGGIDALPARPASAGAGAVERLFSGGGVPRPLLLAPTRVTPRKNLELAIEIVATMRRSGMPAGLVVTGPADPHDREGLAYLARLLSLRTRHGLDDCVVFFAESEPGAASEEEMERLYTAADAVVLPSVDEGFGLPILEAAVRHVPIVCSNLPSLREIGGEEVTYIDPGCNPRLGARAVLDAVRRGPSGELASRVQRGYSWPGIYERLIDPLIRRALEG